MARRRARARARARRTLGRRWWWRTGKFLVRHSARGVARVAVVAGRGTAATYRRGRYMTSRAGRAEVVEEIRNRRQGRRRWVTGDLGSWRCAGCGVRMEYRRGRKHTCEPTPAPTPAPRPVPKPQKRPKTKAKSPVTSTGTRGARIVRAGTAAERFAMLATVEPETIHDFEQVCHDVVMGLIQLGAELEDLAERTDLDRRVTDKIRALGESVADLSEPARTVRGTFRRVYRAQIAAAEEGITMPSNPQFFQAS